MLNYSQTVTVTIKPFFQLPQLKALENPDEFEINDEDTEITEEEYQKSSIFLINFDDIKTILLQILIFIDMFVGS